jgi:hypothetical protein
MPFADLVRTANTQGLLRGDWPVWRRFREMRVRTSHTYDTQVASQVASAIPGCLEEAEHFYAELPISFVRICLRARKFGCFARG